MGTRMPLGCFRDLTPTGKIGYSIFLYHMRPERDCGP
jgi:hypothetical protein